MIDGRRIAAGIIAGFLISAAAYADMVPVSAPDAGPRQSSYVCGRTDLQYTNFPNITDLDLWSVAFLPRPNADVRQTSPIQYPPSLTDGASSFSLCLYALMGLGLVRSAPWGKRLSFGFLPEWYHAGGPFQIGHSHAVTVNNLSITPVHCFGQPVFVVEGPIPEYRLGTVVSLWRKSQFTSTVLAPRGPPVLS
jgi:hypothetical protein